MKPGLWEIHAIALAHVDRFFAAAQLAALRLEATEVDRAGLMTALAGNVLWARSPYDASNEAQEEAMALTGALVGTLGDEISTLLFPGSGDDDPLRVALAVHERSLRGAWDEVLGGLVQGLKEEGGAPGPAELTAWVWARLFPLDPWPLGFGELAARIGARLRPSAPPDSAR